MGNKISKPEGLKPIQQVWHSATHNLPLADIYQHQKDGILAQKNIVRVDPKYTVQNQLKIYGWRKQNNYALVRAYDAQQFIHPKGQKGKKNNSGICVEEHDVTVMTEPIVKRFSQLPQLTFPQTLYCLRQSLKAYEEVYKRIGPIHVNEQIMGINTFGQLKCWVHQNWAENHPQQSMERNVLKSTKHISRQRFQSMAGGNQLTYSMIQPKYRDESDMTRNVIDIMEGKCQEGRYPKQFSDYMFIKGSNFREARAFLQQYIARNSFMVPNKIIEHYILSTVNKQQSSDKNLNEVKNTAILSTAIHGSRIVNSKEDLIRTRPEVSVNSFTEQRSLVTNRNNNFVYSTLQQPIIKRSQSQYRTNNQFKNSFAERSKFNQYRVTSHSIPPPILTTQNTVTNVSNTNAGKNNIQISYKGANTHNYSNFNGHYLASKQLNKDYGSSANYASTAQLSDSLQVKNPTLNDDYITSSIYKGFGTSKHLNSLSPAQKDYSFAFPSSTNSVYKTEYKGIPKNNSTIELTNQVSALGGRNSLINQIQKVQSKNISRDNSFSYGGSGAAYTYNKMDKKIAFESKY